MRFRRLIRQGLVASAMLLAVGMLRAEETSNSVLTALSSTTLTGYVDTSAVWSFGGDSPAVAAIPEPSTTVLLVAGVVGCWLARVGRGRANKPKL
jgi:hypothetical protein